LSQVPVTGTSNHFSQKPVVLMPLFHRIPRIRKQRDVRDQDVHRAVFVRPRRVHGRGNRFPRIHDHVRDPAVRHSRRKRHPRVAPQRVALPRPRNLFRSARRDRARPNGDRRSSPRPHTICGVVYEGSHRRAGCQFSFTCDGKSDIARDRASWARAEDIAEAAMDSPERIVRGATSFHVASVHPRWAAHMIRVTRVGTHIFYRPRHIRAL
jgi:hypothetical protein